MESDAGSAIHPWSSGLTGESSAAVHELTLVQRIRPFMDRFWGAEVGTSQRRDLYCAHLTGGIDGPAQSLDVAQINHFTFIAHAGQFSLGRLVVQHSHHIRGKREFELR
jgi:hypothetical protein